MIDEGIELTDQLDVVDLIDELEATTLDSITTRTLLDPDWDFFAGDNEPPEVLSSDIPMRFYTFIGSDTGPWPMLAEDCVLTLYNHILGGRQALRSLVDTGLIFRIEAVSSVIFSTIILYNELGIEVPDDVPDSSDSFQILEPDSIPFLISKGLQSVAYSYLTKVWRSVDQLIYNRAHVASNHLSYSPFIRLPLSFDDQIYIDAQTSWDSGHGYAFWHRMGESAPDWWFGNPTCRIVLRRLLADTDSPVCISFPELTKLPEHPGDIMLVDPAQILIVNKIAFAFAWIVVELRAEGLWTYAFRENPVLTADRVLCVAREYALIEEFLDQVSSERSTSRGAGFARLCAELV